MPGEHFVLTVKTGTCSESVSIGVKDFVKLVFAASWLAGSAGWAGMIELNHIIGSDQAGQLAVKWNIS